MTDFAILFAIGLGASIIVGIIVDLGLMAMGKKPLPTPRRRRRAF